MHWLNRVKAPVLFLDDLGHLLHISRRLSISCSGVRSICNAALAKPYTPRPHLPAPEHVEHVCGIFLICLWPPFIDRATLPCSAYLGS